jgi:hypothetical protein
MKCYDSQVLEKEAKSSGDDATFKEIEKKLANKKPYDITPANCLADLNTEFWISPVSTPDDEAVRIFYENAMVGYRIGFEYKNHLVILSPLKNAKETVKNWKHYHQQVTQLLDSMVVQQITHHF